MTSRGTPWRGQALPLPAQPRACLQKRTGRKSLGWGTETKGGCERGCLEKKKMEKTKRFPSGSCPLSHTVLGYCLIIFGLQSRFPKTSSCAEGARSLHPRWLSPLRQGYPCTLPLPLPQSEGLTDFLGSSLQGKYIYLYIIYIFVCVLSPPTHTHIHISTRTHSLVRLRQPGYAFTSPPTRGKGWERQPIPWGCAFAFSSPTPKARGSPLLVRKAAGRWELATSAAPCQTHLEK